MEGASPKSGLPQRPSLLALKVHYFLHAFGSAPILPYLTVVLRQMGVPGSYIALMISIKKILQQLIAAPLGGLMDKFPTKKIAIYRLILLGQVAGFYFLFNMAPLRKGDAYSIRLPCQKGEEADRPLAVVRGKADPCLLPKLSQFYARNITCQWECKDQSNGRLSRFSASFDGRRAGHGDLEHSLAWPLSSGPCSDALLCSVSCESDPELDQVLNRPSPEQLGDLWRDSPTFWAIFACVLLGGICGSSSSYFQDAICQQMVQGSGEDFGKQRLWGSVGWGLCSILVGHIVDVNSKDRLDFDYSTSLNIFIFTILLDAVVVGFWKLPASAQAPPKRGAWMKFSSLLFKKEILKFLLFCAALGSCFSTLSFQFILLEDLLLDASCQSRRTLKLLQGLALALCCLTEVPTFLYSGRLLARFGHATLMNAILGMWALRMLWYSCLSAPWQSLPIELMGGVIHGLSYPVVSTVASEVAPEGTKTTAVSFAYAVMDTVGYGIGGNFAGHLYDTSGGLVLYRMFSVVIFFALLVNVWLQKGSKEAKYEKLSNVDVQQ